MGRSTRHRTRSDDVSAHFLVSHTLTALQEFETRLLRGARPKRNIEAETNRLGGTTLVTQKISGIEVSRRFRLFLANRLVALGWALKGSCKPCAHRLFTTARWLVPEAQRFLIQRTVSHNRNRRTFEWLLGRIQPRVLGGLLIVLAFVGLLDLAMRATATDTHSPIENSSFQHEPLIIPSESKAEPMQGFESETASLPRAQIAPVPLPLRKPEGVYKVPNGKGAKAIRATKKRMTQQKGARQKSIR